ncbi:MAG TPA: hypothetical protein VNZ52_05470, partial [Candidatus Thermoplasmatota archaeon]|nr:hypothetical protein [Candidatus Thermoplasmatota archaeon]
NLTALSGWAKAAATLGAAATDASGFFQRALKNVDPDEDRVYAAALLFANLQDGRANELGVKYSPKRRESEATAVATLEEEVRHLYSSAPLIEVSKRWGYEGLLALHAYDTAASILEQDEKTFDDLAQAGAVLKAGSETTATLLLRVSPLGDADRLKHEAAKVAPPPEVTPQSKSFLPAAGTLLALAAVGAAVLVARRR